MHEQLFKIAHAAEYRAHQLDTAVRVGVHKAQQLIAVLQMPVQVSRLHPGERAGAADDGCALAAERRADLLFVGHHARTNDQQQCAGEKPEQPGRAHVAVHRLGEAQQWKRKCRAEQRNKRDLPKQQRDAVVDVGLVHARNPIDHLPHQQHTARDQQVVQRAAFGEVVRDTLPCSQRCVEEIQCHCGKNGDPIQNLHHGRRELLRQPCGARMRGQSAARHGSGGRRHRAGGTLLEGFTCRAKRLHGSSPVLSPAAGRCSSQQDGERICFQQRWSLGLSSAGSKVSPASVSVNETIVPADQPFV